MKEGDDYDHPLDYQEAACREFADITVPSQLKKNIKFA